LATTTAVPGRAGRGEHQLPVHPGLFPGSL